MVTIIKVQELSNGQYIVEKSGECYHVLNVNSVLTGAHEVVDNYKSGTYCVLFGGLPDVTESFNKAVQSKPQGFANWVVENCAIKVVKL